MAAMTYDRREQDLGNILLLEHVNVRVPDQQAATLFYIAGLGLTRDPYLMVSVENMWANAGQTQFHLPTGKPNVVQGHVELIVPDLDALTEGLESGRGAGAALDVMPHEPPVGSRRLASVRQALAGTQFAYEVRDKHVAVTCPWGNQFRCVGPGPEWADITLGIGRVEVPVARGAAALNFVVVRAVGRESASGSGGAAAGRTATRPGSRRAMARYASRTRWWKVTPADSKRSGFPSARVRARASPRSCRRGSACRRRRPGPR